MPYSFLKSNSEHLMLQSVVFATIICFGNRVRGEIKFVDFYRRGTQCITQAHWDARCIDHAQTPSGKACRSLLHCVVDCLKDTACIGVSSTHTKSFFRHYSCSVEDADCNNSEGNETRHLYFSKRCHNGGKWQPEEQSCTCVDGMFGPTCQSYPKNCPDLTSAGYGNGNHKVKMDLDGTGLNPVPCICVIWGDYYHVSAAESFGSTTFNRTWVDYRDGFAQDFALYWVGLKNWHQLSSHGFHTMILKVSIGGVGYVRRDYTNFRVADESQNFAFSFDSTQERDFVESTGLWDMGCHLNDCFGSYTNVPFSTYDRDQDGNVIENCALTFGKGGWFPQGCNSECDLLGYAPLEWGPETPVQDRMSFSGMENCMTSLADRQWIVEVILWDHV